MHLCSSLWAVPEETVDSCRCQHDEKGWIQPWWGSPRPVCKASSSCGWIGYRAGYIELHWGGSNVARLFCLLVHLYVLYKHLAHLVNCSVVVCCGVNITTYLSRSLGCFAPEEGYHTAWSPENEGKCKKYTPWSDPWPVHKAFRRCSHNSWCAEFLWMQGGSWDIDM